MQKYLMFIVSEIQQANMDQVLESKLKKREALNCDNLFMHWIHEKIKARQIRLAARQSSHLLICKYVHLLSRQYDQVLERDDYSIAADIIEKWKSYEKGECVLCEVEARFVFLIKLGRESAFGEDTAIAGLTTREAFGSLAQR